MRCSLIDSFSYGTKEKAVLSTSRNCTVTEVGEEVMRGEQNRGAAKESATHGGKHGRSEVEGRRSNLQLLTESSHLCNGQIVLQMPKCAPGQIHAPCMTLYTYESNATRSSSRVKGGDSLCPPNIVPPNGTSLIKGPSDTQGNDPFRSASESR